MKIKIKYITTILLSALLTFSACGGCSETNNSSGSPGNEGQDERTYTLIDKGLSSYKILIPEETIGAEAGAATLVSSILETATSCAIPVVSDGNYDYAVSDKIISIGETVASKSASVSVDKSTLNYDGYKIVSKGGQIFVLAGESQDAYIYSAYELLNVLVDYEAYSYDEIYYKRTLNVEFSDMDILDVPAFRYRDLQCSDAVKIAEAGELAKYLRINQMKWSSYGYGHNVFKYLPTSLYAEEHPEWYTSTNQTTGQFCWSQPSLVKKLCEVTLDHVLAEKNISYFAISQNDGHEFCVCGLCDENAVKYGARTGAMVVAINTVSRYVQKYFQDNNIDREVYFYMLAYNSSLIPPAVENPETGKWEPGHPDVVCEPNVRVVVGIPGNDYYYTMEQTRNLDTSKMIKGWACISDNLMYHGYFVNFTDYFVPFCNYNSMQANYQFLKENGFDSIYEQGGWTRQVGFKEYSNYVGMKLRWNPDEDFVQLTNNFFDNYYKEASPDIKKFFDEYRDWYAVLVEETKTVSGLLYVTFQKGNFPEPIIARWEQYCKDGMEKIEYLKANDMETYQKVYNRIDKLTLFFEYVRLVLNEEPYPAEVLTAKRKAFKEKCSKYEVSLTGEGVNISRLFQSWGV